MVATRSTAPAGIKFQYKPRTYEATVARAESSGRDTFIKGSVRFLKLAPNDNQLRILPATFPQTPGKEHYGIDLWVHYNVGPNGDSFLCPLKHGTKGAYCPICNMIPGAATDDEKYALKPTHRVLAYFINRAKEDEGPVVWAMPWSKVDQLILNASVDKISKQIFAPDDPVNGFDIIITKTGQMRNTQYMVNMARVSSPLSVDATKANAWLEFAAKNPLPDILQVYDGAYIEQVFGGGAPPAPEGVERVSTAVAPLAASTASAEAPSAHPTNEAELQALSFDDQASLAIELGLDLEKVSDEQALYTALIGRLGFAKAAEEPAPVDDKLSSFRKRLGALKGK